MLMPRLGMAALFSCCTRSTSRTSADAAPARHSRAAADNEIRMRGMTDSPKGSKDECRCVLADYDPGGCEPRRWLGTASRPGARIPARRRGYRNQRQGGEGHRDETRRAMPAQTGGAAGRGRGVEDGDILVWAGQYK